MGDDARRVWRKVTAAYRVVYGFSHLWANGQGPGSAPGSVLSMELPFLYVMIVMTGCNCIYPGAADLLAVNSSTTAQFTTVHPQPAAAVYLLQMQKQQLRHWQEQQAPPSSEMARHVQEIQTTAEYQVQFVLALCRHAAVDVLCNITDAIKNSSKHNQFLLCWRFGLYQRRSSEEAGTSSSDSWHHCLLCQ